MLGFGAFTQQAVAIGLRQVENATTNLGSVASALSYTQLDFVPISDTIGTPVAPNYIKNNDQSTYQSKRSITSERRRLTSSLQRMSSCRVPSPQERQQIITFLT
jgi:hypothetical protein